MKKMKRNGTKYNEISVQHLLGQIWTLLENNSTRASVSKRQKSRTEGKRYCMFRQGTRMWDGGTYPLISILITRSDYLHTPVAPLPGH